MITGLSTEVIVSRSGSSIALTIRNRDQHKFRQVAAMSPEMVEMLIRKLSKESKAARRVRAHRRLSQPA